MRVFVRMIVIAASVGTAACGHAASMRNEIARLPDDSYVLNNDTGGIRDSVQVVIRDFTTLQEMWAQATSQQDAPPPVPRIDFEREMLLLVAVGRKQPDIELQVDSAGVRSELLTDGSQHDVYTALFKVTDGCRHFDRDVYPVQIVRVPRFDGDVRFIGRRERKVDCP